MNVFYLKFVSLTHKFLDMVRGPSFGLLPRALQMLGMGLPNNCHWVSHRAAQTPLTCQTQEQHLSTFHNLLTDTSVNPATQAKYVRAVVLLFPSSPHPIHRQNPLAPSLKYTQNLISFHHHHCCTTLTRVPSAHT